MKDHLKNPNLYFIAVPIVATLFVIFVVAISLPAANGKLKEKQDDYGQVKRLITRIVELDRDRLYFKAKQEDSGEFDYSSAVVEIAKLVRMSNYDCSTTPPNRSGGKLRKRANVDIKVVDIEKLSKFISLILLRWPDLKCSKLTIDKLPAGKDSWKANIQFVYTYQ